MHTLPSTLPQTLAKQNGPTSRSGVHSKSMRSPGFTCRRKRTLLMPANSGVEPLTLSANSTQQVCAAISHWMTPGTIGLPGKWPLRKYSSPRTV